MKRYDNILRKVYSIDTEAGNRLRYIITRALCDKRFAERIFFVDYTPEPSLLTSLFIFRLTEEGHNYWWSIYQKTLEI